MTVAAPARRLALLAVAGILACNAKVTPTGGAAPNAVVVQVQPPSAQVVPGGAVSFAAVVTGTAVTTVTWSVREGATGGSVTSAGAYTAPATAGTYHVVATSQADATVSGSAAVTVTPAPTVAVAVTPPSAATNSCLSVTFSATVTGAANTAVTWSVQEGAAGGSITAAGVYTAPPSAGTYHVVATSQADPTKSAAAAVAVTDRIVSVAVSPAQTSVLAGGSAAFTATVTTTCGTFTSTKVVAAPN